jgi:hypothetical protein
MIDSIQFDNVTEDIEPLLVCTFNNLLGKPRHDEEVLWGFNMRSIGGHQCLGFRCVRKTAVDSLVKHEIEKEKEQTLEQREKSTWREYDCIRSKGAMCPDHYFALRHKAVLGRLDPGLHKDRARILEVGML